MGMKNEYVFVDMSIYCVYVRIYTILMYSLYMGEVGITFHQKFGSCNYGLWEAEI